MWVDIILGVLPLIIPYTILGENLSSIILSIIGVLYLILNRNKVNLNKKFIILIISLNIIAISSIVFISPYIESISGLTIYLNVLIYYIAYSKSLNDKNKELVLKYMVYSIGLVGIYYILVQGLYYNVRIYGNIGYANSYALILLIGIYFNRIREKDKYVDGLEIILILGILFTGSRTTLLLFSLYLLLRIKEENKKSLENIIKIFEGALWALIQYVIYSSMGLSSIIILPIIIFIYIGIKKSRIKKYIYGCLLIFSIAMIIIGNNNTLKRIRNISIDNGSFQERIVFYEDSIKYIIKQPLGNGINMFQYKSYEGASAFYDVKYIHNSLLQISYDIGIIGGIIFLILVIMGIILILSNRNKNYKFILTLYVSIIIHSLLDFDMSYSTFGILLAMLVSFSYKGEKSFDFKFKKLIAIPILTILIYIGVFEGSIELGKSLFINDKIEASNKVFTVANNMSFDLDYRGYFNKAQGYKKLYDESGNKEYLDESLDLLINSNEINNDDPRVIWNITYLYMKQNNEDKSLFYMDELLFKEKFNEEVYKLYNEYIMEKKKVDNDDKYSEILNEIQEKREEALGLLNYRAKYMKNQLRSEN